MTDKSVKYMNDAEREAYFDDAGRRIENFKYEPPPPIEGVFIPAGARYWFEKAGTEDLEILHIIGFDRSAPENPRRYNAEAKKNG